MADASAALGIIWGIRLGNERQLDTSHLWNQQVATIKHAKLSKAVGIANPTGSMAKELSANDIN